MDITLFKTGDPLSADKLNAPLQQIGNKIDSIEQQVSQMTGERLVIARDMRIDPTYPPSVGNLVYIEPNGFIRAARAVWNTDADESGIVMPAESAYIFGVVLSINWEGMTADVATSGSLYYSDLSETFITNLMPSGTSTLETGTWYLSDAEPGHVMRASGGRPYMRIPAITIDISFRIILTNAMPFSGYHMHKGFKVPANASWTESNSVWRHSGSELDDLAFFNWTEATFLIDGVYDYAGKISLEPDGSSVAVLATEDMSGHVVDIFTAIPDSHDEPVVRGVRIIGAGRANASSQNGLVTIGIDGWSGQEPESGYSGKAVSGLTENGGYTMTHVVSKLSSDGTASVREGSNGEWIVTNMGGPFVRPMTVSLENSTVANSNGVLYYIFPSNRASAVLGSVSIPKPPDGWSWNAYPFIDAASSTVNLSASMSWCPDADIGTARTIGTGYTTLSLGVVATGSVVTGKSSACWVLSNGGLLWLRLSSSGSNAADMGILSFGIWLEAVQNT